MYSPQFQNPQNSSQLTNWRLASKALRMNFLVRIWTGSLSTAMLSCDVKINIDWYSLRRNYLFQLKWSQFPFLSNAYTFECSLTHQSIRWKSLLDLETRTSTYMNRRIEDSYSCFIGGDRGLTVFLFGNARATALFLTFEDPMDFVSRPPLTFPAPVFSVPLWYDSTLSGATWIFDCWFSCIWYYVVFVLTINHVHLFTPGCSLSLSPFKLNLTFVDIHFQTRLSAMLVILVSW